MENLSIVSHLTHNPVIISSPGFLPVMSPIWQVDKAIKVTKTITARKTESSQPVKPMSVDIGRAERFQISLRLKQ